MSIEPAYVLSEIYSCSDSVRYAVSQSSIILFDTDGCRIRTIEYPQVAIWDFIIRNYSYYRMVRLLMIINTCNEETARLIIDRFIEELIQAKILVRVDTNG